MERRDEEEIPPVRIPRRRAIDAQRRGHVVNFPGAHFDNANDRRPVRRPPDVGDKASVRREGEIADAVRRTRIEHPDFPVGDVEHAKLVTVIRESDYVAGRRGGDVGDAADVAAGHELGRVGRVGAVERELLVAAYVRNTDEALAVVQPLGETSADATAGSVIDRRPLEERHGERLSARHERQVRSVRVRSEVFE
jgi:hypothetical protein